MLRVPRFVTPVLVFSVFIQYRFDYFSIWKRFEQISKTWKNLKTLWTSDYEPVVIAISGLYTVRARARFSRRNIDRPTSCCQRSRTSLRRPLNSARGHRSRDQPGRLTAVAGLPTTGAAGPPPCTLFSTSSFAKRWRFFLPSTRRLLCERRRRPFVAFSETPISDVGSSFVLHGPPTCTSGENETSCLDGEILSKVR